MEEQVNRKRKEKLLNLAQNYAHMLTGLTAIPHQVVPYDNGTLTMQCSKGCAFCEWVEERAPMNLNCSRFSTEAGLRAKACGGSYIYFCESGFIHFAAPVLFGGRLIATVVGGPVQVCTRDGKLVDYIMDRMGAAPNLRRDIVRQLTDVSFISMAKLGKAADTLAAVISHVNRAGEAAFDVNGLAGDKVFIRRTNITAELIKRVKNDSQKEVGELLVYAERRITAVMERDLMYGRNLVLMYVALLARLYLDYNHSKFAESEANFGRQTVEAVQYARQAGEIIEAMHSCAEAFITGIFCREKMVRNEAVHQIIEYVNKNYMHKLTLDKVAVKVYLSTSYLSKLFKEEVGCNFNTYVNRVRMEKAKMLLADEKVNIVDVSVLVGFEDQSYFSKVFRRITGMTPKQYKELL